VVVGEVAEAVDVVVIGGGPGGYAAALHAAQGGRQVTLIERDAIGGTCLNVGCIPSKALIEAAEVVHRARTGDAMGIRARVEVDQPALAAHLRRTVEGLTRGVGQLLDGAGVRVLQGTARFVHADRLVVDEGAHVTHLEFRDVVVATGSRPATLPHLPVDGHRVLDSTGALALEHLPASVAVVGAGYIGVELGTALAKLGSRVTLVELADRVLPGLDASLGRVVARRLGELGVDVRLGVAAEGLDDTHLLVAGGRIEAEVVVVAVGRVPSSDDLGLQHAGVEIGRGGLVTVDGARRTTRRHVYAIGDLTAGPALAHKAMAEAEVVGRVLGGDATATFDPAAIPQVVFSDPEVVTVGLTFEEATAQSLDQAGEPAEGAPRRFRFPFTASARARTLGAPAGYTELVADATGTVLGVHLVGAHVSELAGEAALAVELAATVEDVAATIHPHPTMSEALAEAALGVLGHPLHVRAARRESPGPR
jgi:dihydrolipoamide dehydrogenase